MKLIIAIFVIAILVHERQEGFWPVFKRQMSCLVTDLRHSLFLPLITIFSILILLDSILLSTIQSVKHPLGVRAIRLGGALGNNINFWCLMCGLYILCKIFSSKKIQQLIIGAIFSSVLTGLVCNVIKHIVFRPRPQAGYGPLSFFNVAEFSQHKGLFLSLPSGDVALVAGAAGFLFFFVKDLRLRIVLALLPLLTCASRIYLNRHWPSDTILSLCLGVLIGHYLWRAFQARSTNYTQLSLNLRASQPFLASSTL